MMTFYKIFVTVTIFVTVFVTVENRTGQGRERVLSQCHNIINIYTCVCAQAPMSEYIKPPLLL